MRVALIVTCLADNPVPDVGKATCGCLERLGHQVSSRRPRRCCGQMPERGFLRDALPPGPSGTAEVLRLTSAIVVPSGSCPARPPPHAMVARRTADEEPRRRRAEPRCRSTFELAEFLTDVLGWRMSCLLPARFTYHRPGPPPPPLAVGCAGGLRPLRCCATSRALPGRAARRECAAFGGTFASRRRLSTAMRPTRARRPRHPRRGSARRAKQFLLMHSGGAGPG